MKLAIRILQELNTEATGGYTVSKQRTCPIGKTFRDSYIAREHVTEVNSHQET